MQVLVSTLPNAIFLDGNCFEHSLQLCVLGGLKAVDELLQENGRKWRYYSALAILANCVRDSTKDVFSSWCSLFGEADALENVKKLIPRCVSSRWGSVDNVEKCLLSSGLGINNKWPACLNKVFLQKLNLGQEEWMSLVKDAGFSDDVAKTFCCKDSKKKCLLH